MVTRAPPPPPKPRPPRYVETFKKDALLGIVEPPMWDYDHGKRREPVVDTDLNRVIRRVGWHHCLKCRRPFFSEDVMRLRLCGGTGGCREDEDRLT